MVLRCVEGEIEAGGLSCIMQYSCSGPSHAKLAATWLTNIHGDEYGLMPQEAGCHC